VLELAYEHMNEPEKVTVETEFVTADRVRQIVYFPANDEKISLLIGLLNHMDASRTMVFVNTKIWAEKIANALERKQFSVALLSGDVPQTKRERLLKKFQAGEVQVLVATDVAARGLHIDEVSHVFNFDLPQDAEDYVHRIGRTARLGAEGDAISFACERYAFSLPAIEEFIGQKLPVGTVDPAILAPVERAPLASSQKMSASDDPNDVLPRHIREKQALRAGGGGSSSGSRSRPGAPPRSRSGSGTGGGNRTHTRSDHPEPVAAAAPSANAEAPAPARPRAPRRTPDAARIEATGPAASHSDSPAGDASEGAKKRRRRGGRGRNRARDGATPVEAAVGASNARATTAARSHNDKRGNADAARTPSPRSGQGRGKPARPAESSPGILGTIKRGFGLLARGLGIGKKP
jgi:ATP-dependent RNA helicase RhlB